MKKLRIGAATFPTDEAGLTPLSHLVAILYSISDDIHIISGNAAATLLKQYTKPRFYLINHRAGANSLSRVMHYVATQFKILWRVIRLSGKVDVWLFPIGGDALLPSVLFARMIGKPAVLSLSSSAEKMFGAQADAFGKIVILLTKMNYALASGIIVYSENLIDEWRLTRYRKKIAIAHEHFLDFDKFKVQRPLGERDNLVGFIGRLSAEKGILNFLEAIPLVLRSRPDTRFLIAGDGKLRDQVEQRLSTWLSSKARFAGWVPHDELPGCLNELKLLVVPSYTEGLPNVLLEAMACGTPVLAAPVGTMPDIVRDGEAGFTMKDNSPDSIAENVIRALSNPNLDEVAENARKLVQEEFTFQTAVEKYRRVLSAFVRR